MSAIPPKALTATLFAIGTVGAMLRRALDGGEHMRLASDFLDRNQKMVRTRLRRNVPLLLVGIDCMLSFPSHPESKGRSRGAAMGPATLLFLQCKDSLGAHSKRRLIAHLGIGRAGSRRWLQLLKPLAVVRSQDGYSRRRWSTSISIDCRTFCADGGEGADESHCVGRVHSERSHIL
jgi:hypothetical protein